MRARVHPEPGRSAVTREAVPTAPGTPSAGTPSRDDASALAPSSIVLEAADRYVGVRYRLGGSTPSAFDCSGLVRYVFARAGVALPRTAREQARVGRPVAGGLDSLRRGDLLFFATHRGRAGHVGIYAGDGLIVHASAGSRRVRYDDLRSRRGRWFVTHLSGVRRVLDDPGGEPGPRTLAGLEAMTR